MNSIQPVGRTAPTLENKGFFRLKKDLRKNRNKYIMVLPVLIYFILFCYKPMYGAIMAFMDYSPSLGFINSPWVGFKHFIEFFNDMYFLRIMRNTFLISIFDIVFGFPAPIILALLMNEIKSNAFKRTVQTVSYLPYFISMVVICGLIKNFTASDGMVNYIIHFFGGQTSSLLQKPEFFKLIYITSNIWQQVGFGSIIYLAAIASISPEQYEASMIDGAGRLSRIWHVTLPGLLPTIVILLILRIGNMLNVGFEKILLLYNPTTYETADVISTFVYRQGLESFNWSYSAAVGLFNSTANFLFLIAANMVSRKLNDTSLW